MSTLTSQSATIDIYPHETRSIAGHSQLNRVKFFSLADSGSWFESKTENMLTGTDYFLDTLDLSFGRALGLVYSETRWGNTIREDAARPGFADMAYLQAQAQPDQQGSTTDFRSRFGTSIDVAYHDRHNAFPDFFSKIVTPQSGDQWIPSNLDAATELTTNLLQYKWNDFFRPAYFELVNEPHWSFTGRQDFADWHTWLAASLRENDIPTLVGGPCSSVGYYYRNQYQDLDNFTGFIDNTGGDLDFYSFHVYDYMGWNAGNNDFTGRVSTGLPIAGVIDALGGYMKNKYDKDLKMVISEHGGYITTDEDAETDALANQYFPGSGFDWDMERRSISNHIMVSSAIANTMTFMDNPHVIMKSVPFILLESFNWDPRYYSSMMVANNFSDNNNFVESKLSDFFKYFADVSGRRVRIKCEDPDLQHHAFVEGNTLSVLFNNLSSATHLLDLNLVGDDNISEISIKRLQRREDFRPQILEGTLLSTDEITLAGREAIVVTVTFTTDVEENTHYDEIPFYSEETAQGFSNSNIFNVEVDHLSTLAYAYLRIGVDRPVNSDRDMTVKLNGTTLDVPMEDAAERFEDDRSYASMKKIHFDASLLRENNEIEVSFTDGRSGGVGSVVIRAGLEGFFSSNSDTRLSVDFKLSPNPSSEEIFLQLPETDGVRINEVIIYNTLGMAVKQIRVENNDLSQAIEIAQFPAGNYFVALRSGAQVVGMKKFVKQ
jgi:hypothetical protein